MRIVPRAIAVTVLLALLSTGCGAPPEAVEAEPLSDIRWPAGAVVESSAMRRDGSHVVVLAIASDPAQADAAISGALEAAGWIGVDRVVEGGLFQRTLEREGRRLDLSVEPTGESSARAELSLAVAP